LTAEIARPQVLAQILVGGAGGLARETAAAVRAMAAAGSVVELVGFLDDDPTLAGSAVDGYRVVGGFDAVAEFPDALVVVATGRPDNYTSRLRLVERLQLPATRYTTIVHPSAQLADTCTVGHGTILLAAVVATASVAVGCHVAVMPQVVFTHDDVVGDYATVASGVLLGGNVTVGEGAYLGAGARVREGVAIGPWAMVGMGSLVTRDVPAGELWLGTPARPVRAAPVAEDLVAAALAREAGSRSSRREAAPGR
jgi:sugar O-acyltransferase (sialic acid O-acetyltransferase NeuD family)